MISAFFLPLREAVVGAKNLVTIQWLRFFTSITEKLDSAIPLISTLTIASGVVTVADVVYHRRILLVGEGGVADNLTKIAGGNAGEIAIISPYSDSVTITVKDGTDLILAGSADFAMDSIDDLMMLECKSAGVWREVSRANNGT